MTAREPLLRDAVRPVEDETERLIVPENPLMLARVICDEVCTPACPCIEDGPLILKSTTLTVKMTACDSDPDTPVTVTVNVPAIAELTVSVEIPVPPELRLTLVGLRRAAVFVVERVTAPLKLFMLVRVRPVLLEKPA